MQANIGANQKEVKGFMAQLILPPLLMFSGLMVEFVEPYQRLFRWFLPAPHTQLGFSGQVLPTPTFFKARVSSLLQLQSIKSDPNKCYICNRTFSMSPTDLLTNSSLTSHDLLFAFTSHRASRNTLQLKKDVALSLPLLGQPSCVLVSQNGSLTSQ